jgi:hypothetical protein
LKREHSIFNILHRNITSIQQFLIAGNSSAQKVLRIDERLFIFWSENGIVQSVYTICAGVISEALRWQSGMPQSRCPKEMYWADIREYAFYLLGPLSAGARHGVEKRAPGCILPRRRFNFFAARSRVLRSGRGCRLCNLRKRFGGLVFLFRGSS